MSEIQSLDLEMQEQQLEKLKMVIKKEIEERIKVTRWEFQKAYLAKAKLFKRTLNQQEIKNLKMNLQDAFLMAVTELGLEAFKEFQQVTKARKKE